MEESRTNNSKRNIFSGLVKQIVNLALSFAVRTLIIYYLGPEYQGLSGLFTSILQVLNLTDLGFSTAVLFILYKPIAEKDNDAICGIINFLKKIYLIVGISILLIGMTILPFLKYVISGDIPNGINIYILFIIYLLNASLSYVFFAYKGTLLSAMQRENVVNNIYTITFIGVKLIQVITIVLFSKFSPNNYYAFTSIILLGTFVNNILLQVVSKKMFPNLRPNGAIPLEAKNIFKRQISSVFIGRISDVARNSLDNIIISAFFGLILVAVYDNYYYIYSALYGIMGIIIRGIMASVGNSIATESVEKNYNDMLKINFIFMLITGWCSICMYCLYQPFMLIWMKGDANLLMSEHNMILMCVYFYAINMTYVRSMYLDGKGLFRECRWWCVIEALANLTLNIILGKLIGLTGIIVATIVTIVIFNYYGRSHILFKYYFKKGELKFHLYHLLFLSITFITAFVSKNVCFFIPFTGFLKVLINLVVCTSITLFVFFVSYFKTRIFKESKTLALSFIPRKKQ